MFIYGVGGCFYQYTNGQIVDISSLLFIPNGADINFLACSFASDRLTGVLFGIDYTKRLVYYL
ncbi:MAG: hypothetical protein QM528_03035 [Phycisphaerales bacterium]|nr:hypothetical protein [Phycisphaerales bacterium]